MAYSLSFIGDSFASERGYYPAEILEQQMKSGAVLGYLGCMVTTVVGDPWEVNNLDQISPPPPLEMFRWKPKVVDLSVSRAPQGALSLTQMLTQISADLGPSALTDFGLRRLLRT